MLWVFTETQTLVDRMNINMKTNNKLVTSLYQPSAGVHHFSDSDWWCKNSNKRYIVFRGAPQWGLPLNEYLELFSLKVLLSQIWAESVHKYALCVMQDFPVCDGVFAQVVAFAKSFPLPLPNHCIRT